MRKITFLSCLFLGALQAYTVESGWNMVGNCGSDELDVTKFVEWNEKVFKYNSGWSEYSQNKKEFTKISKNSGFWYYANSTKNIDVKESSVSLGSYVVSSKGWNLVSARGYIEPSNIENSSIWVYNKGFWSTYPQKNGFEVLSKVQKGSGFWINTTTENTKVTFSDPISKLNSFFE